MARPINIQIQYQMAVNQALAAGRAILGQIDQVVAVQNQQVVVLQAIEARMMAVQRATIRATEATRNWGGQITQIGIFANKTFASISSTIDTITRSAGKLFSVAGSQLRGAGSSIGSAIGKVGTSLAEAIGTGGLVQQVGNILAAGASGFVRIGTRVGEAFIQGLGKALAVVPDILGQTLKLTGAIAGLGTGILGQFLQAGGLAAGLFITGITNASGAVISSFSSLIKGMTDIATGAFSALGTVIADTIESGVQVLGAVTDRLVSTVGDIAGKLGDVFGKAFIAATAIALPIAFQASGFRENLSATYGVVIDEISREQFETLVSRAKAVSAEVGISLSELPQGLFKTVSPGFTGIDQTLRDLAAGAKLAAIGNVDLARAIDTTNIVLDAYGRNLNTVESSAVALFNSTRLGRLEIEDLTNTIGLVAGVAANANIPLNDLLTTFNLASRTLPPSRVATGLSNAIGALSNPVERTRIRFQEFFDSISDGANGLLSFQKILEELRNTGIINDPAAFAKILPDIRGRRAVLAANRSSGPDLSTFKELLGVVSSDAKTFEDVAEVALNTISRRFSSLGSTIIGVGDTFLEKFKSPIVNSVDAISKVIFRLNDLITGFDDAAIQSFSDRVVRFIEAIPDKVQRASAFVVQLSKDIAEVASGIIKAVDQALNLTSVFSSVADGNFREAFNALFGSPAIQTVTNFFETLIAQAKVAFERVFSFGKSAFDGIIGIGKTVFDNSATLKTIANLGGGIDTANFDPIRFLAQSAFGVNPIQAGAKTTGSAAIGSGAGALAGAAVGAGVGAPLFGIGAVPGALIGAGIGAIGGGAIGILDSKDDVKETRSAIDDFLIRIKELYQQEKKLLEEQVAEIKRANEIIIPAQRDIAASEESAREFARIKLKADEEIATLQAERARVLADSASISSRADKVFPGIDLDPATRDPALFLPNILRSFALEKTAAEIKAREAERSAEIERRSTIIRESVAVKLAELNESLIELKAEADKNIRALAATARRVTNREDIRSLDDSFGDAPTSPVAASLGLLGSSRFTDLIGGEAEKKLIDSIESLISALDKNTEAQAAVRESLRPFNLSSQTEGLNIRARANIRRAEEERAKAFADSINRIFESRAPDSSGIPESTGIFGFGDRGSLGSFGPLLRALGGFGDFRTSLPGEGRDVGDTFRRTLRGVGGEESGFRPGLPFSEGDSSVAALLGILGSRGPDLLSPTSLSGFSGRSGIIDLRELLTGAPSRSADIRGRSSPFDSTASDDLRKIRESIEKLSEEAFAGGSVDGRDILRRLARDAAISSGEPGDTEASQVKILEQVRDSLLRLLEEDRAKGKFDELSEERRARLDEAIKTEAAVSAAESERGKAIARGASAEEIATAAVPPIDEAAILAKNLEAKTAEFEAFAKSVADNNSKLVDIQSRIDEVNQAALEEMQSATEEFIESAEKARASIENLSLEAGTSFAKNSEVLNQMTAAIEILTTKYSFVTEELQRTQATMRSVTDRLNQRR